MTSDWNYLYQTGTNSLDNLAVGVLKLEPGADAQTVLKNIQFVLPKEVKVMTHNDFIKAETAFWFSEHPAGTIFNFGAIMGFIIGVVIS